EQRRERDALAGRNQMIVRDAETLFLRTLEDLEARADVQDPYEILGCSALLRKPLLDSYPLVDQVNAKRKVRLEFHAGTSEPADNAATVWSLQDGFDPETGRPGRPT